MMVEYLIIWMVFSCGMAVVSYFMWKNKRKEVRNLLEGSGEKVCMTLNGGGSTLDLPVCVLASLVMPGAYCFAWAFVGGMEGTLEDEKLSMFFYALIFIAFLMLAVMVLLLRGFIKMFLMLLFWNMTSCPTTDLGTLLRRDTRYGN